MNKGQIVLLAICLGVLALIALAAYPWTPQAKRAVRMSEEAQMCEAEGQLANLPFGGYRPLIDFQRYSDGSCMVEWTDRQGQSCKNRLQRYRTEVGTKRESYVFFEPSDALDMPKKYEPMQLGTIESAFKMTARQGVDIYAEAAVIILPTK